MDGQVARAGGRRRGGRAQPRGKTRRVNTRRSKNKSCGRSFGFAPGTGKRIGGWMFAGMAVALLVAAIAAFRVPANGRDRSGRDDRQRRLHHAARRDQGHPARLAARHLQRRLRSAVDGDAAGRPRGDPASACSASAGSRRRASIAACPTHWSSTSSSARPAAIWQNNGRAEPDRRRGRRARAGAGSRRCPICRGHRRGRQPPSRRARRTARGGSAPAPTGRRRDLGRRPALGPALPERRAARLAEGDEAAPPRPRRLRPHGPAEPACSAAAMPGSTCGFPGRRRSSA